MKFLLASEVCCMPYVKALLEPVVALQALFLVDFQLSGVFEWEWMSFEVAEVPAHPMLFDFNETIFSLSRTIEIFFLSPKYTVCDFATTVFVLRSNACFLYY